MIFSHLSYISFRNVFLGADVGEDTDDIAVRHGIALVEVAQCRAELAVGTAELGDDDFCVGWVGVFDLDGILEFFLICPH